MDIQRSENEQIEYLKQWWQKNGNAVVIGLVIGITSIFGWRVWQDNFQKQVEIASDLYERMVVEMEAENKDEEALKLANELINDYPATPYASFAAFTSAYLNLKNGQFDVAKEQLQWVLDEGKNEELQYLARVRLARVLLSQGDADAAMELVDDVSEGSSSINELRGDIFVEQGKIQEAKDAYWLALASVGEVDEHRNILQLKLDDLGGKNP